MPVKAKGGANDIRARPKEEDHATVSVRTPPSLIRRYNLGREHLHESMGEADFGPIDGAIAGCLEESEIIGVLRVQYNAVNGSLLHVRSRRAAMIRGEKRPTLTASMTV